MGPALEKERGAAEGEDGDAGRFGDLNFAFSKNSRRRRQDRHSQTGFGAGQETEGRREGGDEMIGSHDVPTF